MSGTKCIHCGEDCGKYPIIWEDKAFCCHGCETVYKLLNENKLYQYYEFENNPGIKIEQGDFGNKYAYLDNDEIKEKLIEFTDGEISKTTLFIPSIHCSSCIWLLEHLNRLNSGIIQSQVNFVKKEVVVTYREKLISLRQIVELLASIHYLPQITLEDFDRKKAKKTNRHLLYKIGIAGFAFGNIMLLSVPHYIPGKELIGENYKNFFAWLSLMLSIPVVVYCSNDYIITAFKNLKHRVININLPIAIGIITLFIQSAFEVINKAGPGYLDSLAGLVFFLLIGKWYQNKTYQALSFDRDYKSYFPVAVTRVNEGEEKSIPLKNIQIGDRILIRNRELIPADAILVAGDGLIDYSFVTGESRSIQKNQVMKFLPGASKLEAPLYLRSEKKWNKASSPKSGIRKTLKTQKTPV